MPKAKVLVVEDEAIIVSDIIASLKTPHGLLARLSIFSILNITPS